MSRANYIIEELLEAAKVGLEYVRLLRKQGAKCGSGDDGDVKLIEGAIAKAEGWKAQMLNQEGKP